MEDQNIETADLKELAEEESLTISDKFIGVFTEPKSLFTELSTQKPKTTDWLIPLLCVMAVTILLQITVFSRPDLKQQSIELQMEATEQYLYDLVENGQMSQEQADQTLEAAAERMDQQMGAQLIIGVVAVIVISFIMFFVISGVFILSAKFALGGEGSYMSGLTSYGLPMYIIALQIIVSLLLIVAFGSIDMGTNLTKLAGWNIKEFSGYIASFVDPFSIWFYSVVGIAFAKMFKSESTVKYVAACLGIWVTFGILFFFVAQQFPILQNFIK